MLAKGWYEAFLEEEGENMRTFESGATRDTDEGKLQYKGFISPYALKQFAEYMHKNRYMTDGSMRDSDNWKRGIPVDSYCDSLIRHIVEFWTALDNNDLEAADEIAPAIFFNIQGYMHERAKIKNSDKETRNE
jgi:hypothetical protein